LSATSALIPRRLPSEIAHPARRAACLGLVGRGRFRSVFSLIRPRSIFRSAVVIAQPSISLFSGRITCARRPTSSSPRLSRPAGLQLLDLLEQDLRIDDHAVASTHPCRGADPRLHQVRHDFLPAIPRWAGVARRRSTTMSAPLVEQIDDFPCPPPFIAPWRRRRSRTDKSFPMSGQTATPTSRARTSSNARARGAGGSSTTPRPSPLHRAPRGGGRPFDRGDRAHPPPRKPPFEALLADACTPKTAIRQTGCRHYHSCCWAPAHRREVRSNPGAWAAQAVAADQLGVAAPRPHRVRAPPA